VGGHAAKDSEGLKMGVIVLKHVVHLIVCNEKQCYSLWIDGKKVVKLFLSQHLPGGTEEKL
jgi:hypothetical protein